jgi:hypothetical protein
MRLAGSAFENVENDPHAIWQAIVLVLAAGLARGAGAYATEGVAGLVGSTVVAVVLWLVAGLLIWGVGVKRFGCTSDYPEVLRTLGFAATPLLVLALGAFDLGPLRTPLWVGAHAWATLALTVATREALDVSMSKALAVCLLALAVGFAVLALIGMIFVEWGAFD